MTQPTIIRRIIYSLTGEPQPPFPDTVPRHRFAPLDECDDRFCYICGLTQYECDKWGTIIHTSHVPRWQRIIVATALTFAVLIIVWYAGTWWGGR